MRKVLILAAFLSSSLFADLIRPDLIGGKPAQPGDFREVVYIRSGASRCTASIVGPRVIATAAHCVKDGGIIGPVSFEYVDFVRDGRVYVATCKHSPLYAREQHDLALCQTEQEMFPPFAAISRKGPKMAEDVLLSGFGCVKKGGGGGNDSTLRVGTVPVVELPGAEHFFTTRGAVAVCFGDSGGPAFLVPKKKERLQIGINSMGNIEDRSLMTALWTQASLDFMNAFAVDKGVQICGVNKDC